MCYWQIYRNYTYIILHCPNFLIHIVNFAQNKINDVTLCTLRTGIVYYQLILWGVFTIFEFHTFIFGFTTTLLYNSDRIRLKWTVQTLQLNYGLSIFLDIMQEVLIIQKNNFIQFNYLMFSLTINVVVLKVATYILRKSLISPKSRLLSRIGSRQTGVPYWFLFLRNISGDVIDMKRADRYVNYSLREEHVMFLKVLSVLNAIK